MGERRELEPDEDLSSVIRSQETVFVTFHADWCAPCVVLEEFVDEVIDDLDAPVVQVDVAAREDVAEAHDVTTEPTMLVFEDGQEVERMPGLPERETFRELVDPWC